MLGLGYPGGPAIEAAARTGNPSAGVCLIQEGELIAIFHFRPENAVAQRWAQAVAEGNENVNDFGQPATGNLG